MTAHRPVRDHRAEPDEDGLRCVVCACPVCRIEDSDVFAPFWRHKPSGYRWGDTARYWRERALAAEAQLRRSA